MRYFNVIQPFKLKFIACLPELALHTVLPELLPSNEASLISVFEALVKEAGMGSQRFTLEDNIGGSRPVEIEWGKVMSVQDACWNWVSGSDVYSLEARKRVILPGVGQLVEKG